MSKGKKTCPFCKEEINVDAIKCKHCQSMLQTQPTSPYDTLDLPLVGEPEAAGRVFSGRYRIIKRLGRGGMGVVYLARDEELDMDVALKFLPVELATDRRALEQLRSEAKLSMSLSHANIIRLHTLDTSGRLKCLVMEYVDGPTLLDLLRKKERLTLDEALPIIRAVCRGLDYAHSMRVLHRDLKPENIMLTSKGEVKIADFGIARQMRESMSKLSQKTISGTPAYMAPEHIMGENLTVRSDVYSLGTVVYELLAGHPPFYKGDILAQIRFKDPPPIPGIPKPVNTAILKTLSKNADSRPSSADAFYKTLTAAVLKGCPGAVPVERRSCFPQPAETPAPTIQAGRPDTLTLSARKKRIPILLIIAIAICLGAGVPILTALVRWYPQDTAGRAGPPLDQDSEKTETQRLAREEQERKLPEVSQRKTAAQETPKRVEAQRSAREETEKELRETAAADAQEVQRQAEAERLAREEQERRQREAQALAGEEQGFKDLLTAARKALDEKRYNDVLSVAEQALSINPGDATARMLISQANAKKRDFNKLLTAAKKALEDKRYDEAVTGAEEALELKPDDTGAMALRKESIRHRSTFTNTIGMKFIWIQAGNFMMGSKYGDEDERPVHRVEITKNFYMQTTEVTQAQWSAIMGNNPSRFRGDDFPVNTVNWQDAQDFIKKLSAKEGREYRLPTEAEWEYACRAGSTSRYYFGDDDSTLGQYAWYYANSSGTTHPVGRKKPNAWGLYDMHGNVWEWCQDWYGKDYYSSSPPSDPQGPTSGESRMVRGGCWVSKLTTARYCRSANRLSSNPSKRFSSYGFRLLTSSR